MYRVMIHIILLLWRRNLLLGVALLRHARRISVKWGVRQRSLTLALALHGHLALPETRWHHSWRKHTRWGVWVILLGNWLALKVRAWLHPHSLALAGSGCAWMARLRQAILLRGVGVGPRDSCHAV